MPAKLITLEMTDKDWGKVAVALDGALGRARKNSNDTDIRLPAVARMRLACDAATLARIRTDIKNQRRAIRYGQKTDQSVSKCKNGHVGPMARARRQAADKKSWIAGEYCEGCHTYVFPASGDIRVAV